MKLGHYNDTVISAMASQITSLRIVYSTVFAGVNQRKHQCSASLASVRGIHRWPVTSPHKAPVTRKMFPFDDVIMTWMSDWNPDEYCPWLLLHVVISGHLYKQNVLQSAKHVPSCWDPVNIDGLVQDCSISSTSAMEILWSSTKQFPRCNRLTM